MLDIERSKRVWVWRDRDRDWCKHAHQTLCVRGNVHFNETRCRTCSNKWHSAKLKSPRLMAHIHFITFSIQMNHLSTKICVLEYGTPLQMTTIKLYRKYICLLRATTHTATAFVQLNCLMSDCGNKFVSGWIEINANFVSIRSRWSVSISVVVSVDADMGPANLICYSRISVEMIHVVNWIHKDIVWIPRQIAHYILFDNNRGRTKDNHQNWIIVTNSSDFGSMSVWPLVVTKAIISIWLCGCAFGLKYKFSMSQDVRLIQIANHHASSIFLLFAGFVFAHLIVPI